VKLAELVTISGTFRREGDYWTIVFRDRLVRVRHTKGLEYISLLLRQPGKRVHVSQMAPVGVIAPRRETDGPRLVEERARVRVTKAIRSTARRISAYDPVVGELLNETIRTGHFCCYTPRPQDPLCWDL